MTIQIKTKYTKGEAELRWGKYANGQNALQLFSPEGEPLLTASVCMVDYPSFHDQIYIKNWSENEGVLAALVKAGIIEDSGHTVPAGYTEAHVCRVLVEMKDA